MDQATGKHTQGGERRESYLLCDSIAKGRLRRHTLVMALDMNVKRAALCAVEAEPCLLVFGKSLRGDRKVVLTAVTNYGYALRFASPELRADKKLVLAAVQQYGLALRWASKQLCADREIVVAAVRQKGSALVWASPELQADPELQQLRLSTGSVGTRHRRKKGTHKQGKRTC